VARWIVRTFPDWANPAPLLCFLGRPSVLGKNAGKTTACAFFHFFRKIDALLFHELKEPLAA
jgi:hypothetical protein